MTKAIHRLLRLTVLALILAVPFGSTRAIGSPVSGPAPVQDKMAEFKQAFAQAAKINAKEEMGKLVRQYNEEAILRILAILDQIASQQGNDAIFEEIGHLRAAWRSTIKTSFVEEVEKYYSLLNPSAREERSRYIRAYQLASRDLQNARTAREINKVLSLSPRFEALAAQLESVGDLYYAGQCWGNAVACNHPDNVGVSADFGKMADLLGEFVRTREQVGLKDYLYSQNKGAYVQLSAQGFGKNAAAVVAADGGEGGSAAGADSALVPAIVPPGTLPSGDTIESRLTFEVLPEVDSVERPNYNTDDTYQMWMGLDFRKKGTKAEFARVTDGPSVTRLGSSEIKIDADQDGTPELPIPVTGNVNLVEFPVGKGESARPWAILTTVGNSRDFYQGISVNLAPNDDAVLVYYVSASSLVGEIAGLPVRVIDEDLDGIYGNPSKTFGWMGLTPENFQPEMDSIMIGEKAKRAVPWSEYMKLGKSWYKLETSDFGSTVKATPFDLETGRLKLNFKGPKPSWLVVRGTGRFKNCIFDLAGPGNKGVEVPVGSYNLYYGEVRKGKKLQEAKTLILPGKDMAAWDVAAGKTVQVTLGKPFGFDFTVAQTPTHVKVLGNTVSITGAAGERYERPWNCVPRPTMSVRKAGGKKGSKPKNMEFIVGTDKLYEVGWEWAWSPLDTEFKKSGGADTVEVQLVEKKNKLFGKVESDWKQ